MRADIERGSLDPRIEKPRLPPGLLNFIAAARCPLSDFLCRILVAPKRRLDSQFVHFVNHDNDVMAENFAQHFVPHRHVCFRSDVIPELRLNHAEGRFRV